MNITAKINVLLFVALQCFTLQSCTMFNVLVHNTPDTDDYKIFPYRSLENSSVPYRYPRQERRNITDTLHLPHPLTKTPLLLEEYLRLTKTKAFLIIQNDTLIYQRYFDGYSEPTLHCSFSIAKSLTSMVAGLALDDGSIKSVEQTVTEWIPLLKGREKFDSVTVEHLLQMKSGMQHTTTSFLWDAFSDEAQFYYSSNMKDFILNSKFAYPVGTYRQYKPEDPTLMAWVVEAATKKSVTQYFEEKIWQPMGAEYPARWSVDAENGLEKASSSFHSTAIDLAKIGSIYLHKGFWQGKQLLSRAWVEKTTSADEPNRKPVLRTAWQPTHSYFWWIPLVQPRGDFYADGYKGQFLYINITTQTVIVKFSDISDELHDMPFRSLAQSLAGKTH
jgi:CubicO group peptidase (beta-lactamase class C family)